MTPRTLLIMPPFWPLLYGPPITLPTLVGYLEAAGREGHQLDANIDLITSVCNSRQVAAVCSLAEKLSTDLSRCDHLSPREQHYLVKWAVRSRRLRDLPSSVPEAIATLRGESFYDFDAFDKSQRAIRDLIWVLEQVSINGVLRRTKRLCQLVEGVTQYDDDSDPVTARFKSLVQERIQLTRPSVVGLSVPTVNQLPLSLLACRIAKEIDPTIVTTLGGYLITTEHEEIARTPSLFQYVDFCIGNEGEQAIVALGEYGEGKLGASEIPNATHLSEGRICTNTKRSFKYAQEARASYEGVEFSKYMSPSPVINIQLSRGCYWNKCTFCDAAFAYSSYKPKKATASVNEIAEISRATGSRHFFLNDEAVAPAVLRAFAEELIERGIQIYWTAELRFERAITRSTLELLQKSGCVRLMFGVESGSQRVLDLMEKGVDLSDVTRILQDAYEIGMPTRLFCLTEFPGETEAELESTYTLIKSLPKRYGSHASFTSFRLHHKSLMAGNLTKFGIILSGDRGFGETERFLGIASKKRRKSQPNKSDYDTICWPACGGENLLYLGRPGTPRIGREEIDRWASSQGTSLHKDDRFRVSTNVAIAVIDGDEIVLKENLDHVRLDATTIIALSGIRGEQRDLNLAEAKILSLLMAALGGCRLHGIYQAGRTRGLAPFQIRRSLSSLLANGVVQRVPECRN